jgi:hypothetical protein
MRSILNAIANASIPVPMSVWVARNVILILASVGTLYAAYSLTPYSVSNVLLGVAGVYVLNLAVKELIAAVPMRE